MPPAEYKICGMYELSNFTYCTKYINVPCTYGTAQLSANSGGNGKGYHVTKPPTEIATYQRTTTNLDLKFTLIFQEKSLLPDGYIK